MAETYQGSCHCGAVRFQVKTELHKLAVCNCSICSRAGWRLAFAPAADFKLLQGADSLTDYMFGKKSMNHPFCKVCGIRAFSHGSSGDGEASVAVNVRCLEGVEAESFEVMQFDGKSL